MGKLGGFDDSGLDNTARIQQDRLNSYYRGYAGSQKERAPEKIRFLDYLIESLDYEALLIAFKRVTGIEHTKNAELNNAVLKHFVLRPSNRQVLAFFNGFTNSMGIEESSKEFNIGHEIFNQSGKLPKIFLYRLQLQMIHEMAHALSRNRLSSKRRNNQRTFVTDENGFSKTLAIFRNSPKNKKTWPRWKLLENKYEALNEGVTQRIAEEVFLEYARTCGFEDVASHFLRGYSQQYSRHFWRYMIFMNEVDDMCEKIAHYLKRDKASVWSSFKRGYMLYGPRYLEKSAGLYEKVFGKNFLEDYKKLSANTPDQALGAHDATYLGQHPSEYRRAWLQHLGISNGNTA